MTLGKIDFSNVKQFEPVPAGQYPGKTAGWESKPTAAGDSINIFGFFEFEFDDPDTGETKSRKIRNLWNTKPGALWRFKRDMIAMGCDPEEFESDAVDVEAIMNRYFSSPYAVMLTLSVEQYVPTSEMHKPEEEREKRNTNRVDKVEMLG